MGFNKYSLQIIIRVVLIFMTLFFAVYFIPRPNRVVTAIFFVLLSISQVLLLIRYFYSINRDLARFLIELKEQDSSEIYFPENLEKDFKNLKYSFQQILDEIKKSRIEKVSQKHYVDYIIENINEGLISFDEDGKIQIINSAAKKLLGIPFLNSVWDLNNIQEGLAKKLVLGKPGNQDLIRTKIEGKINDFLFRIAEVKIEDKIYKVVTFQDLKLELEQNEINSWRKLMRVLTHEMMNSLTPITTLSVASRRILKNNDRLKTIREIEQDDLKDIYKNNETIENRSKGLLDFINQYRQITKVPDLKRQNVKFIPFLEGVKHLFSEEIESKNINFKIQSADQDIEVFIDKKLLEQVIINLIKNSFEAFEKRDKKELSVSVVQDKESILVKLKDNGEGISPEIKDDIFIPFFTTKKQGSGIGLSLSKEIMHKHNGEIYFESQPEEGSTFYLRLKK